MLSGSSFSEVNNEIEQTRDIRRMKLSLAQIGQAMQAVGDYENSQDLIATRVQTDSRVVQPGDLFVCIPGQRFDGHNFAREAVHKGALAVVVERPLLDLSSEVPMLLVQDSIAALADLAAFWRAQFQGLVIAVTGTAGKTSVKEMIASVLEQGAHVGKNYKNWNNKLGVSLSILGMHGREDYWVLEAGVSETGEMEALAAILAPDVAMIVNVGPAHLQGLFSVHGVAREKARLVMTVPARGVAVINRDYPELMQAISEHKGIPVITFSSQADAGADCFLVQEQADPGTGYTVRLRCQETRIELHLPAGRSWIGENVLAAACITRYLGCPPEDIQAGLKRVCLPEHRGQMIECGRMTIIDDCYNANPLSMHWALNWARGKAGTSPLILVLGEMKELGERAEACHQELGGWAACTRAAHVFYFGDYEPAFRKGFDQAGGAGLTHVPNETEFLREWRKLGVKSGLVLVKGSRGCALERFVSLLQQEFRA
ncbi:MAG: UDP-N-acetylmuramoyl-tripeptide--D-alanyl-D-alanine ligase [Desulfovermiculus sp.]